MKEREESKTNKLEASDISQIVEFGQNPSQLFDKPHLAMDEKYTDTTTKIVFDVLNDPPSQKYVVTQYKQKDAEPYLPVKAIVKDRTNITTISTNGELLKKQLLGGKNEYKTAGQPGMVAKYFSIYNPAKEVFTVDPGSVFAGMGDYLIACRSNENSFMVYSLHNLGILFAVTFHKVCSVF